jgi:hypothetical protein
VEQERFLLTPSKLECGLHICRNEQGVSKANLKLLGLAALWIGGAFGLLALAGAIGGWFLLSIPLLMIIVGVLSYRVRCHRCGWSLIKRGLVVALYAPRNCPSCGDKA